VDEYCGFPDNALSATASVDRRFGRSVTLSVPIQAWLTALPNVTLSPNKYTSWENSVDFGGKCRLTWESIVDGTLSSPAVHVVRRPMRRGGKQFPTLS
jgi:hypothetical protein